MSTVLYFLFFAAFLAALLLLPKKKSTKTVGVVLLCIALAGEVLVVNFHSFHLWFGGYEKTAVEIPTNSNGDANGTSTGAITADISGTVDGTLTSNTLGTAVTVTLKDIGKKVGTIRLELDLPEPGDDSVGTPSVSVAIDAKDVTNAASYRSSVATGTVVRGEDRTGYIVLDLTGEVHELRIRMTAAKGQAFTVRSVTLNESVPMRFSALRLCLFMLLALGVYALATFPGWRAAYGDRRSLLRTTAFIMTVFLVIGALALGWINMYDRTGGISTGFLNTSGNQISQELVDAFEAHQVHLLTEPNQEILSMENPYDWSARREAGMYYKWDHLLYEGKYYSYYGIAPVILLFLPYHALTGYYFPTQEAVFLFGALGIIFLTLLFLELADLFCRRIPNNILLCTLLVMQVSSGVWYNFVYDNFYEIAQAAGFLFTTGGFFFLLRSGVIGEGKIKLRHIALATTCLSFAVLSRPTLALYCFASLIFLGFGLKKHLEIAWAPTADGKRKRSKAPLVRYLLAALLPFVLIGGVQMMYNYARFGSVMDFGIQYSLTINDFTRSEYHTDFVMIGLYNFLFAFPVIKPEFPYIFSNFSTLNTNGYYYVANRNAVGLFIRALPSLGYLGAVSAFRSMNRKERIEALCLIVPTCIIVPLAIIFSIWESGYGVRYCTDFAWQFILGGALVLYLIYLRGTQGQMKTVIERAFIVAAVVALMINGAMIWDYCNKSGYLASEYLSVARLFDFWR